VEFFEKALSLRKDEIDVLMVYLQLGNLYQEMGDKEAAIKNFESFIREVSKVKDKFLKERPREVVEIYISQARRKIEELKKQ